ncbi:MAG: PAAR domain-containing protein [Myxococcota bacterium]
MPPQGRVNDLAFNPADAHGCPACPHPVIGPAVTGSPNVLVNGQQALRIGDPGIHSACCGPNTWVAAMGSGTVSINNIPAHRLGDMTTHCGGVGTLVTGSGNVIVGG